MEVENTDSLQDKNIEKIKEELVENVINEAKVSDDNTLIKRVPTFTMSACAKADTMMPINLASDTLNAFLKMKSEGVDFDEFVTEKLKYTTRLAMCNAFKAEQVDAVALAIYNIEKQKGLIVGDMAGIGKGRIAAAILRYAYLSGKIPVFVTERPSLFSDIYRDISAIGGFGKNNVGNTIYPTPLILNGNKACNENDVLINGEVRFEAQKNNEIISALNIAVESGKFPFDNYQAIFTTYSQFSTEKDTVGNDKPKSKYLKELAKNCIFVLDESHNAVGVNSGTGKFFRDIVLLSHGCLFLSATSAKRPEHLQLYGLKTDLMDSSAKDTKVLLDIIKRGGEPMQEYLSSSLANVGQMIRRERSFENCPIEYRVIEQDEQLQQIFKIYDKTIEAYSKILRYIKSVIDTSAIESLTERAIKLAIEENGKFEVTREVKPKDSEELEEWLEKNEGKYEYRVNFKAIKSTRFMIIDTLIMAIKAEFVANECVKHLTEKRPYKYLDGTIKETTIKPIIAVRNTLESLWDKIGVSVNDELKNTDFNLILKAALQTSLNASVTFNKIIIETDEEKRDRKKKNKENKRSKSKLKDTFSVSLPLIYDDFEDKGESLKRLEQYIDEFRSGIFVSPIDKIMHIIEATRRPFDDKYGEGSEFLRISEVTGRKYKISLENGKYYLRNNAPVSNEKAGECKSDKNVFKKFDGFNNGKYDCLIINEVGSTGASAQASKAYKDSRPRSMIIHQVELDVNTEVQKRGRVNRTAQICLPKYTYLTSPIPSEIRRLLMLKRKLRSLDYLTTGSQRQSDELVSFRNKKGEVIEDFYNYIGLEVLNNWLELPENFWYNDFFNENADWVALKQRELNLTEFVDSFCRIMELVSASRQEYFYDSINSMYIKKVEELKADDNFLLETKIENFESALKARGEIKFGLNTSPFNQSVYDEEQYVYKKSVPFSRNDIEVIINQMCNGKEPKVFHKELLEDYKKEFELYLNTVIGDDYPMPKRSDFDSNESYEKAKFEVELKKNERIVRETEYSKKVYSVLERYVPNTAYIVPDKEDFVEWILEYEDKNGEKPSPTKNPSASKKIGKFYYGKFLGYAIDSKAKFKYSAGSIELVFAFVSDVKKMTIKPTTQEQLELLDWIPVRTSFMNDIERVMIDEWNVKTRTRVLTRMLTGNIIDALRIAENRKKQSIITSYKYIKFTTSDNDIRNGVNLRFGDNYIPLNVNEIEASLPTAIKAFADNIENLKVDEFALSMNSGYTERFIGAIIGGEFRIKLVVIGERLIRNAKNNTYESMKKGGEKYKSVFFGDENLSRFIKFNPVKSIKQYPDYTLAKKDLQYFNVEEYYLNDESDKKALYDYMYEVDKSSFKFRAGLNSPENVRYQPDVVSEGDDKSEKQRESGNFEYLLIEPYNVEEKQIPYFVSYRKGEMFGIVTTSKILSPIECVQFGLNPYNLTESQMASNFFSKFSNTETRNLIKEINDMYEANQNFLQIGMLIANICKEKYASPNYVFGKIGKNAKVIGELIYEYINSDEVRLETTKEEAEKAKSDVVKVELKPINEYNIQDYLTLLNA